MNYYFENLNLWNEDMTLIKTSDVKTSYVLKQCFKLDVLAGKDINNILKHGKRIISELNLIIKL